LGCLGPGRRGCCLFEVNQHISNHVTYLGQETHNSRLTPSLSTYSPFPPKYPNPGPQQPRSLHPTSSLRRHLIQIGSRNRDALRRCHVFWRDRSRHQCSRRMMQRAAQSRGLQRWCGRSRWGCRWRRYRWRVHGLSILCAWLFRLWGCVSRVGMRVLKIVWVYLLATSRRLMDLWGGRDIFDRLGYCGIVILMSLFDGLK